MTIVVCFLLDTHTVSISPEDEDDEIVPLAPKGGLKTCAEPLESEDKSTDSNSQSKSREESSSDEDLTLMRQKTVQRKLMGEVRFFYY
jgi:hypothetical protein